MRASAAPIASTSPHHSSLASWPHLLSPTMADHPIGMDLAACAPYSLNARLLSLPGSISESLALIFRIDLSWLTSYGTVYLPFLRF